MNALDGYLAMGGYAAFIWPAFAITLAVLGGLAVVSTRTLRRRDHTLAALTEDSRPRRAAAARAASPPPAAGAGQPAEGGRDA
jgi:heme exporter protein D